MEAAEIISWISPLAIIVGAVLGYGKLQSATKELKARRKEDKEQFEKDLNAQKEYFEKEIQGVQLSKHSKLKEMKADFKERVQICHDRIDKQREFIEKQGEKVETKLDELKRHVDDSNTKVIQTVTNAIASAFNKK